MKTEAQIYRDAIKVLQRDGWCKGTYTNGLGQHCLMGAMGGNFNPCRIVHIYTVTATCISEFNDAHCETIDDAIAALEIAADLAS